jgi:hypothetical protein
MTHSRPHRSAADRTSAFKLLFDRGKREEYVMNAVDTKVVYWHRELPPFDAEELGEHTVEATSNHVSGPVAHGDGLWSRCYESLMAQAHDRLVQEVARLGGDYAHVLDESIEARHNDALGEVWLHGRFTYVLYRRPPTSSKAQT